MRKMRPVSIFVQAVVWTLVFTTFMMGWFPPESTAMLAPADFGLNRLEDLQKVQRVLESKMVQQRLEDVGLTADEIQGRLARLSDGQLHQMANQLDALMPGGDGGLGIVVAILVIAILVVILFYLLGHRIEVKKN
jgi:Family of unknown function (DUF6627)